jgi:hypothetical protein
MVSSKNMSLSSESRHGISVYMRMQWNAAEATGHLASASKRPVRHNRRIERAALWYVLSLDDDCARIVDPIGPWHKLVRPKTGEIESRYEAEAAIRTIPHLVPFSPWESKKLRASQNLSNFQFEHYVGDIACEYSLLFERWHDWLWAASSSDHVTTQSPESSELKLSCAQLSAALANVVADAIQGSPKWP